MQQLPSHSESRAVRCPALPTEITHVRMRSVSMMPHQPRELRRRSDYLRIHSPFTGMNTLPTQRSTGFQVIMTPPLDRAAVTKGCGPSEGALLANSERLASTLAHRFLDVTPRAEGWRNRGWGNVCERRRDTNTIFSP